MLADIIIGVIFATAIYFYVDIAIVRAIDEYNAKHKPKKKKTVEQSFREIVELDRKRTHAKIKREKRAK
jgi:hypothetical protein